VALRLVNTSPGESMSAVKPGQFALMDLKSETLKVPLASTLLAMGLTNVTHHSILPEDDPALPGIDAEVTLETSERRRPVDGTTPRSIYGGSLLITKNNMLDGELGIYEVKMPIKPNASCLAYFKFRTKTAWALSNVDWMTLSNMTGMYFGLEHGTFNTALYAFLRDNTGNGSLVLGGPLQAYNTVRPGQVEVVAGVPHASTPGFQWKAAPDNSVVEIYIFFNTAGYETAPVTGVPLNVPLVEVWTKLPSDSAPVVQAYIPVGTLGTFPSSLVSPAFTNSRPGTSETATIFFGNIARTGGSDVLQLDDWMFFPDFRLAVYEGHERPNHNLIARPDAPVEYRASNNKTPFELIPERWFPDAAGVPPAPSMVFQPGRRQKASHVLLPKTVPGFSGIHRTEPRFEQLQDGIMMEAFISGEVISPVGDGTGMGFGVEDGSKLYQVMMVGNPQRKFYAIAKDLLNLNDATLGYHVPATDQDFTSMKLVRLVVDRRRPVGIGGGKAQLYVDEELTLTTDLSADTFPPSSSPTGLARIGQLGLIAATSRIKLAMLNYLPRYLAWEGVDNLLPDAGGLDAGVQFTLDKSGLGSEVMSGGSVVIEKTATTGGTKNTYVKNQAFGEVDGMQIDFRVQVEAYADAGGFQFAQNSPTGVTLTIFLGNKKVEVGFYDCGPFGRMVAILPSTGDISDIIQQTVIGQPFSASHDWTEMTDFRLIVKGHDRIDLIIGAKTNPPAISIPWREDTNGFDLPANVSTPRIVFGHSYESTSSKSRWAFLRWGLSNGFDIALQQEYPDGYPKYLFGGRALIKSVFDEA
jgi:hypothetical protein